MAAGSLRFGQGGTGIIFVKEHLALKVGGLDEIAVNKGEAANSGASQQTGGSSARGSHTHDGNMSGAEAALPMLANAGEQHLARIPFAVVDSFRRLGRGPVGSFGNGPCDS
jgi:hypothetical protein